MDRSRVVLVPRAQRGGDRRRPVPAVAAARSRTRRGRPPRTGSRRSRRATRPGTRTTRKPGTIDADRRRRRRLRAGRRRSMFERDQHDSQRRTRRDHDHCGADARADDGRLRPRDEAARAEHDHLRVLVPFRRPDSQLSPARSTGGRDRQAHAARAQPRAAPHRTAFSQEAQSGMDASSDRDGYLVAYPDGTRISKVLTPDPVAEGCAIRLRTRATAAGCRARITSTTSTSCLAVDLGHCRAYAGRPPARVRHGHVERRHDGVRDGGGGVDVHRGRSHRSPVRSSCPRSARPRPVPTMEFHSVDDPIARFNGVKNANPKLRVLGHGRHRPVGEGRRLQRNPRVAQPIVGTGSSAGLTSTLLTYPGCRDAAEVDLWRLTGSGHVWPGAPFNTGATSTWILDGVGRGTQLIDANELMWQFFRRHELPAAP